MKKRRLSTRRESVHSPIKCRSRKGDIEGVLNDHTQSNSFRSPKTNEEEIDDAQVRATRSGLVLNAPRKTSDVINRKEKGTQPEKSELSTAVSGYLSKNKTGKKAKSNTTPSEGLNVIGVDNSEGSSSEGNEISVKDIRKRHVKKSVAVNIPNPLSMASEGLERDEDQGTNFAEELRRIKGPLNRTNHNKILPHGSPKLNESSGRSSDEKSLDYDGEDEEQYMNKEVSEDLKATSEDRSIMKSRERNDIQIPEIRTGRTRRFHSGAYSGTRVLDKEKEMERGRTPTILVSKRDEGSQKDSIYTGKRRLDDYDDEDDDDVSIEEEKIRKIRDRKMKRNDSDLESFPETENRKRYSKGKGKVSRKVSNRICYSQGDESEQEKMNLLTSKKRSNIPSRTERYSAICSMHESDDEIEIDTSVKGPSTLPQRRSRCNILVGPNFKMIGDATKDPESNEFAEAEGGKLMTIGINEHNKMKKEMQILKRTQKELFGSLTLWQEKCKRQEVEIKKLLVDKECAENEAKISEARSVSNKRKVKGVRNQKIARDTIIGEMTDKEVPEGVQNVIKELTDSLAKYAQQYTSEMIESKCADMPSSTKWAPNSVYDDDRLQRDWRGRTILVKTFDLRYMRDSKKIHETGCPLVSGRELEDGGMNVKALHFPHSPMEVAMEGNMYSSTEETQKNFIGQSAVCILRERHENKTSDGLEKNVFDEAYKNETLLQRFRIVCNSYVTTMKKNAKETYFSVLGYKNIFAPKPKANILEFENRRKEEMKLAYKTLYRRNELGIRNTSVWRRERFENICATGTKPLPLRDVGCVDNIFRNEAARLAMSQCFRGLSRDEYSSCMYISRLDAVMTCIIDSFKRFCKNEGERNEEKVTKGGKAPVEFARRFKIILPLSTAYLLKEILEIFKREMRNDEDILRSELDTGRIGDDIECLGNHRRELTNAYCHPTTGHVLISLNHKSFSEFVCGWIGKVMDCTILKADKIGGSFREFTDEEHNYTLQESDSEEDDENENGNEVGGSKESMYKKRSVFDSDDDDGEESGSDDDQ